AYCAPRCRMSVSMRRQRLRAVRGLHRGDAVFYRLLHLLEGAHLDLAHALARDAELVGEFFQRDRVVGKAARLEDAPLALVEHGERLAECLAAIARLFAFDQPGFLTRAVVEQPVLP